MAGMFSEQKKIQVILKDENNRWIIRVKTQVHKFLQQLVGLKHDRRLKTIL
jgi:hypothetical protein